MIEPNVQQRPCIFPLQRYGKKNAAINIAEAISLSQSNYSRDLCRRRKGKTAIGNFGYVNVSRLTVTVYLVDVCTVNVGRSSVARVSFYIRRRKVSPESR